MSRDTILATNWATVTAVAFVTAMLYQVLMAW